MTAEGLPRGLRRELAATLGPGGLLERPEDLEPYAADRSSAPPRRPVAVARPRDVGQVSALVRACARAGVAVVARGAGTGKAGGCVPTAGSVVCSLERMRGVTSLQPGDQRVTVLPGTITGELRALVGEAGWFYPPDPASLDECTIGGNVATNAGGPLCVRYGVTGDHVLGLQAVLADGRVLRCGRGTIKGVAGYDLTSLLVGSEGTLGIITEITLRIRPRPGEVGTAWLTFSSAEDACAAVRRLLGAGIAPRALELVDDRGLRAAGEPGGAALLLEIDGAAGTVAAQLDRAVDLIRADLVSAHRAADEEQREGMWRRRRSVSDAIKQGFSRYVSEDVAVPPSRLPELLRRIHRLRSREGLEVAAYGHAGDGNLHVNLLGDERVDEAVLEEATREVIGAALELGGTITGEHGVGLCKRAFLPWEQDEVALAVQRAVKRAIDPGGVLNPGKAI